MRSPSNRRERTVRLTVIGLLLLTTCLTPGCKLFRKTVEFPGKMFSSGGGSSSHSRGSPSRAQTAVMRFADTFNSQIVQATSEFGKTVGTPEARIQALSWRVVYMTSALSIASGPNPNANLLDMIAFLSLCRMVHEEYWVPDVWGEADRPLVETLTMLEADIWELGGLTFSQRQLEEVRVTIDEWRQEHPGKAMTAFVRLPGFKLLLQARAKEKEKKNDVFQELADLLSIDAFEGLEPATREAAELRALGERTLFYAQRAPLVFQAQAELLSLKTLQLPEVKQVIEEGDRISQAAESFAETAKSLPEKLIANLEAAQQPTVTMLAEARTTLDAGKEMSSEVRQAIQTLDAFVERVSPEGKPEAVEEEPRRKFDVREYGEAAAKVGEAAKDLDQLLVRFDEKLPEVKSAVEEVAQRSDRTIDRAMNRLLVIGLVLIGAASAAGLLVRWISRRWRAPLASGRTIRKANVRRDVSNAPFVGPRVDR